MYVIYDGSPYLSTVVEDFTATGQTGLPDTLWVSVINSNPINPPHNRGAGPL